METRASYVIVGAFVLSFFAAIVLAILWLADVDIDDDVTHYDIFFEGSVSGLSIGNPVRYSGIPVGIVTDMRISPDRFGEVQVVIEVPETTPIHEDAVARLEYQGITGVAFIQLNGGTANAPPIRPKPGRERAEIRSEVSGLQQVLESAPEIMGNLRDLASQASKLLNDDNIAHINATIGNIDRFSGALAESSEDVTVLLQQGASTLEQLSRTAEDAQRLVSAFADRGEGLAGATEETIVEARDLVRDMRRFTAQLDDIAKQAAPVIGSADSAIGSYAALAEDLRRDGTALAARLTATLDKVDGMVVTANDRIGSVADTTQDTLGRYSALADTVAPKIDGVASDASEAVANLSAISGELRQAATSIAGAAGEAEALIAENRTPVTNFTATGLYEFTQMLSEMRVLISSLTRITNQIERDPAQFFFGDSQQGYDLE
ncbi:MCE family protein [Rhodospirillaceae bacterium KN72]|uniref:MCE family protein n=1 Tax=Pacificispira spongiicola TaxID=2729598 RepID=A0A7Y0E1H2_9PROT|nr:MlaD family protein [Pacificispira spongiicola]NMM44701.1 MCE family protein [Pacificispira spongiicola]